MLTSSATGGAGKITKTLDAFVSRAGTFRPMSFPSEQALLWSARMIGIAGIGLLIFSSVGGVVMSSRFTGRVGKRFPKLKGNRIFVYHRRFALIGAAFFLLHPVPMLFAPKTTGGLTLLQVLAPFTADRQTLLVGLGTLAFYVLVVTIISSLLMKRMKYSYWRTLHYGTYLLLALGLIHGLLISGEYKTGELFEPREPEKVVLLVLAAIAICFPIWRLMAKRAAKITA